jgi:hypothetical protein
MRSNKSVVIFSPQKLEPFVEIKLGGPTQRGFLIQLANEVEEQGATGLGKGQKAQHINNDGFELV